MRSKIRSLNFGLLFLVLSLPQAHALVSSEVTLSSGYYQDFEGDHQLPVFLYWTLNYTGKNGVEAYFDMGFNNQFLIDQWGYFLYQAYVTVPFSQGFSNAPYRKSRAQLGRQLFSDGFELTLLDGLRLPLYWSAGGGADLIAGGSYTIDEKRFDFSSRLYGGTLHQRLFGATWKAGYFHKANTGLDSFDGLTYASIFKSFDQAFMRPTFLAKGQWKVAGTDNEGFSELHQGYGELLISPLDPVSLGVSYSKRRPSDFDPSDSVFVYKLFSLSPQKTATLFANWAVKRDIQVFAKARRTEFDSPAGKELAQEQELSISWLQGKATWRPSLFHLKSYGGNVWQPAMAYRHSLGESTGVRAEFAAAHIDKINGIKSWGYHTRAGFDARLAPRLLTLALLEAESNHRFELDARFVAFLTYYLF